jgi:HD-GYP domain-containing protein (c-di-GMP phosphodiesterase class II)
VVDLYVWHGQSGPPVLYCRAGTPISTKNLRELADAEIDRFLVPAHQFQQFGESLLASLESFLRREDVPRTDRFAALQDAVAVEVDRTLRLNDCGKYQMLSEKVGRDLVALLADSDILPRDMYRIARHDFHTFTHVTNVAGYCVVLAERMGIRDRRELEQIATAAMLHDVGKRFIPVEILTKPGRLADEERALIEMHPTRGYEELRRRPGMSHSQLMTVYQHHERIDGSGYPVGIREDEIHPWARMLAVVDVFDAMTARRPYRRPATAEAVLSFQRERTGTHFDREALECWNSVMSQA